MLACYYLRPLLGMPLGVNQKGPLIRIPMTPTVATGTGTFVQTIFIIPCLDFNLRPHESGANTTVVPSRVRLCKRGCKMCAAQKDARVSVK